MRFEQGNIPDSDSTVSVTVMGAASVNGRPVASVRPLEFILALAMAGGRIRTQMLEKHLYASVSSRSALATVAWRARSLGLANALDPSQQAYQLATPVRIDLLELLSRLDEHDVEGALRLYRGPCLPRSTSPIAVSTRNLVESRLVDEALDSTDASVLSRVSVLLDDPRLRRRAQDRLADSILSASLSIAEGVAS